MIIEKVQRVANPTRKRKYKVKNPKRRVKLSAKQIRAGFGGKRRKLAKKRRAAPRASNPRKTKKRKVTVRRRKTRRAINPQIMALGYLNPERTRKVKTKKRVVKRRRLRVAAKAAPRRVGNPKRRRRRVVARNPRRRHVRRHRNPDFMGTGMEAVGVLLGVAAQKIAKGFVPASLSSGNAMVSAAISFAVAFAIGKGADMLAKGKPIGKGIALGALASAASDAINVFAPQLSGTIGLSGMGTYQNALFAVPENPIMRGLPAPSVPVAAKGMGGALSAAFGNSF